MRFKFIDTFVAWIMTLFGIEDRPVTFGFMVVYSIVCILLGILFFRLAIYFRHFGEVDENGDPIVKKKKLKK